MAEGYRAYISPEGATSAVTGNSVDVAGSKQDVAVSVEISGTATVVIEGSMDDAVFIPVATVTATTVWILDPVVAFYRCRISSWTSGTVSCKYGAREGRNREMGVVSPKLTKVGTGPQ
jgi:hypothetical protein